MKFLGRKTTKTFVTDSLWSILALGLMNVVSQFLLYPILRNVLGTEIYGTVLYLIGVVNIMATSVGSAANLARLVTSVNGKTYNIDSALWLIAAQALCLPICWGVLAWSGMSTSIGQILLFWLLACVTIWRYYADVEYRLGTNYKGYFLYYFIISVGYLAGIFLFWLTGSWPLILLPGELAGLVFVWCKGTIFRRDHGGFEKARFLPFLHVVVNLMIAQLLVNVVLNADRLVLKNLIGGEAVTLYYIASLVGKTIALITTPLNSVIIGHLAKSKEPLSRRKFLMLSGIGVGLILVILAVCVCGSHIFALLFYPKEYQAVKGLFWLANLAQIIYFIVGILTTVLLRYIDNHYQVVINVFYVVVFVIVTISATKLWGLYGFAVGLLVTNASRYIFATILGVMKLNPSQASDYKTAEEKNDE